MSKKFKLGDWAEWASQSNGFSKAKTGECIAVIPACKSAYAIAKELRRKSGNLLSISAMDQAGLPRDHESYIFALPPSPKGKIRRLYWPRVSALKPFSTEPEF